jgi:hypothetical protein
MITNAITANKENNWSKFQKLNKEIGNHMKKGKPIICPFNIMQRYAMSENVLSFDKRNILYS